MTKLKPNPFAAPPRKEPEVYQPPEGWTAETDAPVVEAQCKDGTHVQFEGKLVGSVQGGRVVLMDSRVSPLVSRCATAIRDGLLTKLVKGELR